MAVAVIDRRVVIEKILRHLGKSNGTLPLAPASVEATLEQERSWAVASVATLRKMFKDWPCL